MSLSQQPVVLITGAAGGIGVAMVAAFEAAGWRVVSTDRQPSARAGHLCWTSAFAPTPPVAITSA